VRAIKVAYCHNVEGRVWVYAVDRDCHTVGVAAGPVVAADATRPAGGHGREWRGAGGAGGGGGGSALRGGSC
jgi:hypothetical protein